MRGSLPFWVGVVAYTILIIMGDRLLLDSDTHWQITVGQWILDHHAVPRTDVCSFTLAEDLLRRRRHHPCTKS